MTKKPHPILMDRETQTHQIREKYQSQVDFLLDLANYGSNLMVRAFESSSKKTSDHVICFVLLKQIVAMIDSVHVLMSQGCIQPAFLAARTLFEASLHLEFMLDGNSERKACLFLVSNYRDEKGFLEDLVSGAAGDTVFRSVLDEIGFDVHRVMPEAVDEARLRIAYINDFLSKGVYLEIHNEFEEYRQKHKKKKHDPHWYELAGCSSISGIAKKYGRSGEYRLHYSHGSKITHSSSYSEHYKVLDGKLFLLPIRNLADICKMFGFASGSALHTYHLVLKNFRPLELDRFRQKYLDEWQMAFRGCRESRLNFVPKSKF